MEEIGASASKEHSLEKSMEKMKSEWADLRFSFTQYRDTVRQTNIYRIKNYILNVMAAYAGVTGYINLN